MTRVETFTDGASALGLATTQNYDLIILDLMLPKLDGWEVCKRIRAESDLPILMLTALGDEVDEIVGLEVGADAIKTMMPEDESEIPDVIANIEAPGDIISSPSVANGRDQVKHKSMSNVMHSHHGSTGLFPAIPAPIQDTDPAKVGRRFSSACVELALASYAGFSVTAPPSTAIPTPGRTR